MAELPKNKMEEKSPRFVIKTPNAIAVFNEVATYDLNISDVYMSVICRFKEQLERPTLIGFLENQVEAKRHQAKRLLDYIKRRKGTICLQDRKSHDIEQWGDIIETMRVILNMENIITMTVRDLRTQASEARDSYLLKLLKDILIKQKRNEDFLEYQIDYEMKLLEMQKKASMSEEAPSTSDKAT